MGSWKALGLYGLPAMFFQSKWETVSKLFAIGLEMCLEPLIWSIKWTIHSCLLFLKWTNLEDFSQFKPIGLCNVLYKLITKIVASRFKDMMGKLISQTQSSFVPGRQTIDNILIA